MIKRNLKWEGCFTVLVGLLLCAMAQVHAQQRGTTGGTRAAGQSRSGSTGGASREYYGNGEVGDAMITVDPDTRRLVIITDEETSQYISQVVSNLDRPRPQVLIKVVFMEVTHRNSLDIGIEGGGTRQIDSSLELARSARAKFFAGPAGSRSLPGSWQRLSSDIARDCASRED